MIDFSLTAEQKALQKVAREFSQEVLKPVIRAADAEPDPQKGLHPGAARHARGHL